MQIPFCIKPTQLSELYAKHPWRYLIEMKLVQHLIVDGDCHIFKQNGKEIAISYQRVPERLWYIAWLWIEYVV